MGIHGAEGTIHDTVDKVSVFGSSKPGGCDDGHDDPWIFFSLVVPPLKYSFPDKSQQITQNCQPGITLLTLTAARTFVEIRPTIRAQALAVRTTQW